MSAIFLITPLVSAAWGSLAGAIAGAAAASGFVLAGREAAARADAQDRQSTKTVMLEMKNSNVVGEAMEREEELVYEKDGVTVSFRKDLRGKVGIRVCGEGKTEQELREIGAELSRRVIQQFVKHRILDELVQKGFQVAEEEEAGQRIRLTLRRWR